MDIFKRIALQAFENSSFSSGSTKNVILSIGFGSLEAFDMIKKC